MNAWERWGRLAVEIAVLALVVLIAARQEIRMSSDSHVNRLRATWTRHGVTIERTIEWAAESDNRVPPKALCSAVRVANEEIDADVKARGPLADQEK